MAITNDDFINPDERQIRLIAERDSFLAKWAREFRDAGFRSDWDHWPTIDMATGSIWHRVPSMTSGVAYKDLFEAYIFGVKEGRRYYRNVQVTGRERETGLASGKLLHVLQQVQMRGPSVCTMVEDGGMLPLPEDQVPL